MTKQQEKTIETLKQEISYLEQKNNQYKDELVRLQTIVDDYFFNSPEYRGTKDKLVVGSEWECVADCYASSNFFVKGLPASSSFTSFYNSHNF